MTRTFQAVLALAVASLAATAQDPVEPTQVGVSYYYQRETKQLVPLEKFAATPKMVRSLLVVEFTPERSPVRLMETRPTFITKLTQAPRIERDIMLVLDTVGGKRTGLLSISPGGMPKPMPGKAVTLEYKKFGQTSYYIRPVAPLRPGEYCLTYGDSNLAYLFGVEANAIDSSPPESAAASDEKLSPNEQRLKKLESLLTSGLITKGDYEARKADILNPPPPKPVTVEDRLRRLEDLLKKGLIGKPDYERKRAEILSEI